LAVEKNVSMKVFTLSSGERVSINKEKLKYYIFLEEAIGGKNSSMG